MGGVSCADGSDKDNPDVTYYTVTFDSNGGTAVEAQRIPSGGKATKPADPTRADGVGFLGWNNGETRFSFTTPITKDITLTAEWKKQGVTYYTVIFTDDDGTEIERQDVEANATATKITDPTKKGFTFVGWYNNEDLFEFEKPITENITLVAGWDEIVSPGDSESDMPKDKPTAEIPQNATVQIKEGKGWLNSAYVIFEQLGDATYEVTVDGSKIDEQLIRYYDEYVWYEPNEAADLSVTWEKQSFAKVVRADALGLKAGSHAIAVRAIGANDTKTEASTVNVTVIDHDRSGFAFTGAKTPGAYNKDGTLKNGAVVIYLTDKNKSTVKATLGGKEYEGIKNITQEIKSKNISTPVAIRVIGKVVATSSGKELSSKDLNSAWALGVKNASEVTIEGVGHDATLYGAGVAAFQSDYIEVANLGLMKWGGGKDGDGISLKADSYAWVHNNDVFYGDAGSDGDQVKGDGSMDLKDDANHITIAYNHFWDSGKMSLCGMKSESGPNYITYHHNWFDHSDSRHPRIRTMTVHVYNNYFDGNAKYGVGVTTGASCFVEGNFFRNAHNPMMSSKQGTDAQGAGTFSGEKGGVIKSCNNAFEQRNANGVKFQFITNKYDYTNDRELGEYKEWYQTVGTQNADGSWTIYDSTASPDTIATNSLIAIEDASNKGSYYQVSKGKTGFYIDVPANVQKVIVTAKCGSSGQSGTANMLSVNGKAVSMNMADDYKAYEVAVTVSSDSTIEIANAHSKNSMNVKEIKVIATSGWNTKLTSGADPTNIDAYEVEVRSDKVPDSVKTRSGGTTYSNFDTNMGNAGLGLSADPTGPEVAKTDVLNFSGRHNSDFAFAFTNATDDASYAKNDALNNALVSYTTGFKGIQGTTQGSTGTGGGNGGDEEEEKPTPPVTPPAPEGAVGSLTFTSSSALSPESAGIQFTVAKGTSTATAKDFYPSTGKVKILKMESNTTISFTTPGVTSDLYTMTINYVASSAATVSLTSSSETKETISLPAGGSLGTTSDKTGTLASVTNSLKGGTAYVIGDRSAEHYIHSIIISKN